MESAAIANVINRLCFLMVLLIAKMLDLNLAARDQKAAQRGGWIIH